jgi:hypothetical protein
VLKEIFTSEGSVSFRELIFSPSNVMSSSPKVSEMDCGIVEIVLSIAGVASSSSACAPAQDTELQTIVEAKRPEMRKHLILFTMPSYRKCKYFAICDDIERQVFCTRQESEK